jgi:hypothetical protein
MMRVTLGVCWMVCSDAPRGGAGTISVFSTFLEVHIEDPTLQRRLRVL